MRQLFVLCLATTLAFGCNGPSRPGEVASGRAPLISDGQHGGNPHFFFLPPMTPSPTVGGIFDPMLEPVIEICELSGDSCIVPYLATFTVTSGPGSETVRVDPASEHYIVNWHTKDWALDASKTYRIRVLVDDVELGFADVDVVTSGKELKKVDSGEYIALKDGRTLPIKFRLEEGVVGSGTTCTGELSFADVNLADAIRQALGLGAGEPISAEEAATLTSLSANRKSISDLSGIECLPNLTFLSAYGNKINDIQDLVGSTALEYLDISGNLIADVTPLAGMTALRQLFAGHNEITSIVALSPLVALEHLQVHGNQLTSLDGVAGMTSLTALRAHSNEISDISALATCQALSFLELYNNTPLTSIDVLANLPALTTVNVGHTNVSCSDPVLATLASNSVALTTSCP